MHSTRSRKTLPLYEQMVAEAARHPELLIAFANDLHHHDRNTLARTRAGDHLLWILQDAGTAILPLGRGYEPAIALYWIGRGYRDVPEGRRPRPYHLIVTADRAAAGTLRPISYDEAEALARAPLDERHLAADDPLVFAYTAVQGHSERSGWPARPAPDQPLRILDLSPRPDDPERIRIGWTDSVLGACSATVPRTQVYAPLGPSEGPASPAATALAA